MLAYVDHMWRLKPCKNEIIQRKDDVWFLITK